MEMVTNFFTTFWNGINDPSMTIPIINLTLGKFLLPVLTVNLVASIIMYFLGKSSSELGSQERTIFRKRI